VEVKVFDSLGDF
jgi:hypothetical protein